MVFFCGKSDTTINMHQCQTSRLSNKVKHIATEIGNTKLLAKLSEGDMVATEAKYHSKCLLELYNQYSDVNRVQSNNEETNLIEGIFLSCFTV